MPVFTIRQDTSDVEVGAAALGRMYPKVSLEEQGRGHPFRFREDVRGDGTLAFARYLIGAAANVTVDTQGTIVSVHLVGGDLGSPHGNGRGGIVFGRETADAEYRESDLMVVNMPEETLLRHGMRAAGADRGVLQLLGHHPRPEFADHWASVVWHVQHSVIEVDAVFENDLVRTAAFEYLVANALECLPIEVVTATPGGEVSGRASLRRAIAYMDSHLADPVTVAEVAEAARLSPRGLQLAFRREYDMTPLEYHRRGRLSAAHAELLHADRTDAGATVAEIALRWGFSNLGRFAALHREFYGTSPADVLHG